MTQDAPKTEPKEQKSVVLMRKLSGRVALEQYPDGYVVTFRGRKEIVWVRLEELKEIVSSFEHAIEIKDKGKLWMM